MESKKESLADRTFLGKFANNLKESNEKLRQQSANNTSDNTDNTQNVNKEA